MFKQTEVNVESKEEKRSRRMREREEKYNEPLKLYGELLHLKDLVITTRKNRINAANRLQRTETFLQGINIYYSCFAAVLSVLSLLSDNKALSVWSVIITIILAISVIYLNAQKYENRAQELKTNYIALHRLLFKIEEAIAENKVENFTRYYEKYCELLQTSENHINLDYLRQIKKERKMDIQEEIEYFVTNFLGGA